jgi:urea transport system permease protein
MTALFARGFDRMTAVFVAALFALAVAVPILNLMLPADSPFQVPTYLVALWGKYACYGMLALAIDLIWGYCGILSLGHGAFFALGGYAMGMYLMRQIGTRGVYADPIRPDFMVFLNWPELPVYWYGFNWFPYAALMVLLVPGLLAFVFGWFAFRSRVTGVYLSIITQALTVALKLGFFRNNFGFGGNNGLTDFKDILGFNVQAAGTRCALFAISCVILALLLLMCRAIVTSKFGKVLIAIRDAESRTRFLGYRVESYKLLVFTLSACMAGVAGALYVPQVGIINPSEFAPGNSIEEVIWVAVGGRGTLTGAILGAVVVNFGKTYFTSGTIVPYWTFAIATLIALAGVAYVRRTALVGAIGGVVAMGAGLLIDLVLMQTADVTVMPYWTYTVMGVLVVVAMATSWDGYPLGAIFGALLVQFAVTPYEGIALAPYWLFALGGLFVGVTLLLPRGIIGTLQHWWATSHKPDKPDADPSGVREPAPAE